MTKSITIEQRTREQISRFLPVAIEKAVKSYHDHMSGEVNGTQFESHHKAAKVAVSHIELLIKLARWADLPDQVSKNDKESAYLAKLMASAEAEIQAYEQEEGDIGDQ